MVHCGVDGVDTDNVSVELLQVWDVSGAGVEVSERVVDGGTGGDVGGVSLVGDTPDVELGAVVGVEELVADYLDGREVGSRGDHGGRGGGDERGGGVQSVVSEHDESDGVVRVAANSK